jgi:ankyrin repeat protein
MLARSYDLKFKRALISDITDGDFTKQSSILERISQLPAKEIDQLVDQRTLLMSAAEHDNVEVVEFLLALGCRADVENDSNNDALGLASRAATSNGKIVSVCKQILRRSD